MRYIHSEETLKIPENGEIYTSVSCVYGLVAKGVKGWGSEKDKEEGTNRGSAAFQDEKIRDLSWAGLGMRMMGLHWFYGRESLTNVLFYSDHPHSFAGRFR